VLASFLLFFFLSKKQTRLKQKFDCSGYL